jgi:DNA replication protein DnaC
MIITGSTGSGKSFIACALGHQACINSLKVRYFNCLKLFTYLMQLKGDGTYGKEMNKIKNQDLIILDDFGLQVLDGYNRLMLLEILEDRHGCKSTIITSQLPPNKWHDVIGDATIADAICDRMVHSSHHLRLKGKESMRKLNKQGGR